MDATNTSTEQTMASTTSTAKVQVWNHLGNGRTTWRACTVTGRRPAPMSMVARGKVEDWYDVRTLDGVEYRMCNPECVRVA